MPREVRSFQFRVTSQVYPWGEWLDGKIRVFERGKDFRVEPLSFVNAARSWSRKRGFTVRAVIQGQTVTLQALLELRR